MRGVGIIIGIYSAHGRSMPQGPFEIGNWKIEERTVGRP